MAEDADRPSLEARVAALEWEVRQLRSEMIRARSSDDRNPSAPAPPAIVEARLEAPPRPHPPAAPIQEAAPRPPPAPVTTPSLDLET